MNGISSEEVTRHTYVADPDLLVERFGKMVYKIALLQTRNSQDAEDVFQEVFLRMMKYKDGFVSEEHAKAWLIRVTQTCSIRLLGCAWNKKTTGITQVTTDKLAAHHMNHEELELYNALAELPVDIRLVLHLYYFEAHFYDKSLYIFAYLLSKPAQNPLKIKVVLLLLISFYNFSFRCRKVSATFFLQWQQKLSETFINS